MVKTLTIMDDAYELLKEKKGEDESFSDIIRKLCGEKTVNLTKWVGALKGGEERLKEFRETLADAKKRTASSFQKHRTRGNL